MVFKLMSLMEVRAEIHMRQQTVFSFRDRNDEKSFNGVHKFSVELKMSVSVGYS